MNGGDPRDALYAALLRGDYSGITEDPSYPVENPRVVPLGLEQMMIQQQGAMEPEMSSRGIDQGYGRQMPIGQQNGRGMMSSATQGGDAAIPQNTNEYKIDAPTFAAAFRKMAELGAPEGVNFIWYSNGKPQGLYKFAYANGQQRKPAPKVESKQPEPYKETIITGKRPAPASSGGKSETAYPDTRTFEEKYPTFDKQEVIYDWNPTWLQGLKEGARAASRLSF